MENKNFEKKHHDLKCVQPYFNQVKLGLKPFEVRFNDRDFKKGDTVTLHEYFPPKGDFTGQYSGEKIEGTITYVLEEYPALYDNYVVFGLSLNTCLGRTNAKGIYEKAKALYDAIDVGTSCGLFRVPEGIKKLNKELQTELKKAEEHGMDKSNG